MRSPASAQAREVGVSSRLSKLPSGYRGTGAGTSQPATKPQLSLPAEKGTVVFLSTSDRTPGRKRLYLPTGADVEIFLLQHPGD